MAKLQVSYCTPLYWLEPYSLYLWNPQDALPRQARDSISSTKIMISQIGMLFSATCVRSYYTHGGNASLPCGVTIAAAAAQAKAAGGGPEAGSVGLPLPTDEELIAFAKQTLGMLP